MAPNGCDALVHTGEADGSRTSGGADIVDTTLVRVSDSDRDAAGATALPDAVAAEVGAAYLSARSIPRDVLVVAAYEHLQAETDRLFGAAIRRDAPDSVRIVFTRCPEPYACDRELIAAVRATRVLEIPTAAIGCERIHPLLGCEFGGPFDRFRAIHDLIGHAGTGFGFELGEEIAAWRTQDRMHGGLARWALATELLAVNSARSILRESPQHKAMLLERRLVRRALEH
jgi:hypothetical protein